MSELGHVALAAAVTGPSTRSANADASVADAFSDYLKRELRARSWTVRYLAMRSGVDHSTISRLMKGQRAPMLRTASRLQAALMGGNPGTLLGIQMDPKAVAPVERVSAALRADPQLDPQRAKAVLRYYLRLRTVTP
jgi:transcriptional regulator with XRE-family HTH domain